VLENRKGAYLVPPSHAEDTGSNPVGTAK